MARTKYLDFDLLVEPAADGYRARVLNSPAGQATADFKLPFTEQDLKILLLTVGQSRRNIRRIDSPQIQEAKDFGGRLFNAVLSGDVRGAYRASVEEASRQEMGLRLRLRFNNTPQLFDLPWEYLYNPSLNRFIALSSRTPIVRYIELPESIRPLRVQPPLRILAMISNPSDYPQLNVDLEWSRLNDAVRDLQARGLLVLERMEQPTLDALRRKLRQGEYHIFHFVGHGGFDERAQDGVLILQDEQGKGTRVSGQFLGTILSDHSSLRLAVLNACEGARTSQDDSFAGVAQTLVQQGVPAVIAMQFEITDDASIAFAREFYSAVGDNYPVDAALAEARRAIYTQVNDLEWGTPVLYMRSPDGVIFDVSELPVAPAASPVPTSVPELRTPPPIETVISSPSPASQSRASVASPPSRVPLTQNKPLLYGLIATLLIGFVALGGFLMSGVLSPRPTPPVQPSLAPTSPVIAMVTASAQAPAVQLTSTRADKTNTTQPTQPTRTVTLVPQATGPHVPTAHPEAVIEGVEPNAQISFWTFYLSPTFDSYIRDTIARFQQVYPGVTVKWQDHQATFLDDLNNAFSVSTAPDVINLSTSSDWVNDYAVRGVLLPFDERVPQNVQDLYFRGLWDEQSVQGKHYQFPWYQGLNVELINLKLYSDGAGLKVEDFPRTVDGLPALCRAIKQSTNTLCAIRLSVNDLLSQMVYEGNVQVISADRKKCTFDSAAGILWLQMYVDMVKEGTVDKTVLVTNDDSTGLDLFTAGKAAFFLIGPNLIHHVREKNPGLYGYLAVAPPPVGKSGVLGKGLMSISVKFDTKYPNASIALAQFFTNPQNMLEFARVVAIYPSTPKSYDDPFFAAPQAAVEDSARPLARDIISTYADIVPGIPNKSAVNDALLQAVQSALFNNVPAQQALSGAAARCNTLISR